MAHDRVDYFARRAEEEEARAMAATLPVVKATHERFAAIYRARIAVGSAGHGRPPGAAA